MGSFFSVWNIVIQWNIGISESVVFYLLKCPSLWTKLFSDSFLTLKMPTKLIHNLSGDEMRKECIKLGLSGRFTMKEALVEIATALVRIGKDPRVHQFHTSQPLLGYYPYQVVISSELISFILQVKSHQCRYPERYLQVFIYFSRCAKNPPLPVLI